MGNVIFEDYTIEVKGAIDKNINVELEYCAGLLEKQVKMNTVVDTGQTKNSWRHKVIDSEHTAYIGSDYENAIWEEFGTGEHALNKDGRKGGWSYQDAKGKWHYTTGKRPRRTFFKTYTALKNKLIKRLQDSLKGMG